MARRDRDAGPAVGYRGIEKIAREKRVSMVEEMPLPEVHYFINSFVASFRLILDELNLTLDELK